MDASAPSPRSSRYLAVLVVVYAALGLVYIWRTSFADAGERVFTLWDDAMITMRYAHNMSAGRGLVWNPGEPVQGYTNVLITLVMAAIHYLPLPLKWMSLVFQLLNLGLLAAGLVLVDRLARLWFAGERFVAPAAATATVVCATPAIWALQGSDVGFALVWLLAAVAAFTRFEARRAAWPAWFYALLALGPLLRHDLGLFSAVILAAGLTDRAQARKRFVAGVAALGAAAAALVLFSRLYYGDPLPNIYYLKSTGCPRDLMIAKGLRQLGQAAPGLAAPLVLALVTLVHRRRERPVLLAGALIAAALAYSVWIGGDWAYVFGNRFFAPLLPLVFLLAAAGACDLLWLALPARARDTRWYGATLIAALAVVGFFASPAPGRRNYFHFAERPMYWEQNRMNHKTARYLRDHTAASFSIAVHWAGVPAYFSGRPAHDVLGMSDKHIAKLKVSIFEPGHSKWDWDYMLSERKPDAFLIADRGLDKEPLFRSNYDLVVTEWTPGAEGKVTPTPGGVQLFLRREAREKLFDDDVLLLDLTTGVARRRAAVEAAEGR